MKRKEGNIKAAVSTSSGPRARCPGAVRQLAEVGLHLPPLFPEWSQELPLRCGEGRERSSFVERGRAADLSSAVLTEKNGRGAPPPPPAPPAPCGGWTRSPD